jgi:hypothetical protein
MSYEECWVGGGVELAAVVRGVGVVFRGDC